MMRFSYSFPRAFAFIALFLLLALAAPQHAAAFGKKAGKDGAKRLEAIFTDIITEYEKTVTSNGAALVTEGKVLVERGDNYYAVTLPSLSLQAANGSRTDIGIIAINAMPGDTDEQWKMTVAIPSPIIAYDPSGKPVITATMGAQNFVGIWHEKFKNFIRFNAQYKDIIVYDAPDRIRLTAPDFTMSYDLRQNENGLWSGPAKFQLSDLNMEFEEDGAQAHISKVSMLSQINDYDINEVIAYQEKLAALNENSKNSKDKKISGAHMVGLYNLLFRFLGTAWDGFSFDTSIEGFSIKKPPSQESAATDIRLARAGFNFAANGFRNNDVSLALAANYDGLSIIPAPENAGDLAPSRFDFDIALNHVPYKDLVEAGSNSLQTAVQMPQMAKFAGLTALMMAPKLMTESGTNMTIKKAGFGNDRYNILMNGVFTADLQAAKGFTGKSRMEISGFDYILSHTKTALERPGISEEEKEKLTDLLRALTVLQLAGQQTPDAARAYDFELNQQGQTLLNGADMGTLFPSAQ